VSGNILLVVNPVVHRLALIPGKQAEGIENPIAQFGLIRHARPIGFRPITK